MTPDTCDDCKFICGETCAFNPVAVPLPEARRCGQFRPAKIRNPLLGQKKVSDRQLWEALSLYEDSPEGVSKYSACVLAVAATTGLTRRSVEERFKTLHKRGIIKIFHTEIEHKRGVMTANGDDGLRAPYPDINTEAGLEAAAGRLAPNQKYTFADLAPHVGTEPMRFSRLAEACHRMSRPAFTRVLREAVRDGYVEKTTEGLYRRTDKASDF